MKRVLVNDPIHEDALESLRRELEVDAEHHDPAQLAETIDRYHAIIVRSATRITREVITRGVRLEVIGRAGTGLDNIDLDAARERGIVVLNTPGTNARSVAELVFGQLLTLVRLISQATVTLKAGHWERHRLVGTELTGKTLGIMGIGRVGREVARLALGFEMQVLTHDKYIAPPDDLKDRVAATSFEQTLAESDCLSIHLPLSDETNGLIGAAAFARMKDGVLFVNTARGGIVDERALYQALCSGKVRGAALDVYAVEPPTDEIGRKLLELENVIATPHIGASTYEAQRRVGMEVAERVRDALLKDR